MPANIRCTAAQGAKLEADFKKWQEAHAQQCAGQQDVKQYQCFITRRHDFQTQRWVCRLAKQIEGNGC
jgi:hypothetical protein